MRKKKIIIFVLLIIVGVALFQTGRVVEAASSQPGSQADPLVTKSYLEQQLAGQGGAYSMLTLERGDEVALSAGGEVIIYRGSANITDGTMINISTSELFTSGNSLVLYSLFVAAQDNTKITAQSSMTVFVKGAY